MFFDLLTPRALLFVCPFHLIVWSPSVSAWPNPLLDCCHSFAEFKKLNWLPPALFNPRAWTQKPWFELVCDPFDLCLPFNFDCQRLAGLAGRDVSCWTQRAAANRPDPSHCPMDWSLSTRASALPGSSINTSGWVTAWERAWHEARKAEPCHNCKTVTLTSTPDKSDKTVKRGGTSNSFLMDELSLD